MRAPARITVVIDEETLARWQLAADRSEFTLDEWIKEFLGVASDPDAGQVAELRARLRTAEAERDELKAIVVRGNVWDTAEQNRILGAEARVEVARQETYDERVQWQKFAVESEDRARAAEARVEALSEALREIDEHGIHGHAPDGKCGPCIARAALACPPQQRGE